jgi:hypothetical protein
MECGLIEEVIVKKPSITCLRDLRTESGSRHSGGSGAAARRGAQHRYANDASTCLGMSDMPVFGELSCS